MAGHHHDEGHGHGHQYGIGGYQHVPSNFGKAFAIGIALNLAYVIAEAFYGVVAHSLALLADAGHNLGDVLGLAGTEDGRRLRESISQLCAWAMENEAFVTP